MADNLLYKRKDKVNEGRRVTYAFAASDGCHEKCTLGLCIRADKGVSHKM